MQENNIERFIDSSEVPARNGLVIEILRSCIRRLTRDGLISIHQALCDGAHRLLAILFIRRISLWHTCVLILGELDDDSYGQVVYGSAWLSIDQTYEDSRLLRSYVSKNRYLEALAHLEGAGYITLHEFDDELFASVGSGPNNYTSHFQDRKIFQEGRTQLSCRPEMIAITPDDLSPSEELARQPSGLMRGRVN